MAMGIRAHVVTAAATADAVVFVIIVVKLASLRAVGHTTVALIAFAQVRRVHISHKGGGRGSL